MWRRILLRAKSTGDYDKFIYENFEKIAGHIDDARINKRFSIKELRRKVSPELWSKLTMGDPLFKVKDLDDIGEMEDVTPHKSKYLPAHLTRPAAILDERQRKAKRMTMDFEADEERVKTKRLQEWAKFPALTKDNYEVYTGVIFCRDPIYLRMASRDAEFAKVKNTMLEKYKLHFMPDRALIDDYYYHYPGKTEEETKTKDSLVRQFDRLREAPIETVPGSTWWLDVNPI
jgi:hypothetical protein